MTAWVTEEEWVCPQPSVQTAPSGAGQGCAEGLDKRRVKMFCLSIMQLLPMLFPKPLSSCVLFVFFYFLATPHGMPDLSSLTRDQIHTLCSGRRDFNTGLPGNSLLTCACKNSCLIVPVSSSVTGCWTRNHLKNYLTPRTCPLYL